MPFDQLRAAELALLTIAEETVPCAIEAFIAAAVRSTCGVTFRSPTTRTRNPRPSTSSIRCQPSVVSIDGRGQGSPYRVIGELGIQQAVAEGRQEILADKTAVPGCDLRLHAQRHATRQAFDLARK